MNVEKQFFYVAEFEQEAAWLSYMHREGWRFQTTDGWRYQFQSCEPEDWVYHMDFQEMTEVDPNYVQMYRDYGWECVMQRGHWFYFRKQRAEGSPEDLAIFSDDWSKMEMIERVIKGTVRKCVPLGLVVLAFQFLVWGTPLLAGDGLGMLLLRIMAVVVAAVIVFLFAIYIGQLDRLQKLRAKLSREKKEV